MNGERAVLEGLWALRQVDARLAEVRAARAALDDGGRLRAEAEAARTEARGVAARLRAAEAALRDKELQLESTEAKRKRAEADLYGGRIRNPKELESLQGEVEALGRAREQYEDQILALLDEVEGLRAAAERTLRTAEAAEQRLQVHLREYEAARSRLDAEAEELEGQRATLAAAIDAGVLRKYEAIAAQEGGVGMVSIVGEYCGGCHQTVPPHFISRVRDGHVVTCERCHRILYLPAWPDAVR